MTNSILPIFGLIATIAILIGFILYSINTTKIIREQEKEITKLKSLLKKQEERETLYIIKDGRNPEFGGF